MASPHTPGFRFRPGTWAQLAIIGWVVAWLAVAVVAAREIRDLESLSETLDESATALDTAGSALETIGALPLVGEGPERLGGEVRSTSAEMHRSAAQSRESIAKLAAVLGLSIAVIPTAPVLGFYLYLSAPTAREGAVIRQALARSGGDSRLEEYLARRSVQNLSYDQLMGVSGDPWGDLEEGRFRRLADAELRRLGVRRPRREDRDPTRPSGS